MGASGATYAALTWGMAAFWGSLGACWLLRPSYVLPSRFWSFTFKLALVGGVLVGLLALILHAGYIWEV